MPARRKVREIMVPVTAYPRVHEDASLHEVVDLLRESAPPEKGAWHGYQSVLVYDRRGALVGLLTLRGLLKLVRLRHLDRDLRVLGASWGAYYWQWYRETRGLRVRDIMRPVRAVTVRADDTVLRAALIMLWRHFNSLPVVDDGIVVGMVRLLDVFWVLGELLEADEE